jgi:cobalamin biosynthesis protein CobT
MKLVGVISTAVLSLAIGAAVPAYAQQEQRDQQEEQKSAQQQDKNTKQAEKNVQQQDKNTKQEEKSAQQKDKNTKQEERNARQANKNTKQEEKNTEQQHAQQAQRAGSNGGGRIPDDRFRANFGREHRFRVSQADYSRDHRFQYGGYWFGFVDPWPTNWLYTQDVFVVEISGVYYLCNPMYPGVNIALSFTL